MILHGCSEAPCRKSPSMLERFFCLWSCRVTLSRETTPFQYEFSSHLSDIQCSSNTFDKRSAFLITGDSLVISLRIIYSTVSPKVFSNWSKAMRLFSDGGRHFSKDSLIERAHSSSKPWVEMYQHRHIQWHSWRASLEVPLFQDRPEQPAIHRIRSRFYRANQCHVSQSNESWNHLEQDIYGIWNEIHKL